MYTKLSACKQHSVVQLLLSYDETKSVRRYEVIFSKSEPLKRKAQLISIRCQDLIQSCPFIDQQSTEFQRCDIDNDLVSSVCTVEPEISSPPELGSLAGSIDDN